MRSKEVVDIEYIEGQLENGYIDISNTVPDEKEFEYVKQAVKTYKRIKNKLIELAKKLTEPNDDRWEKDDDAYYNKIKAQIIVLKEIIGE